MGKKLTVYMIDGTEYGPRLSEIGNWVGKAIYSPRASINRIISRSEFDNPGVYCLKGDPQDDTFQERIYIGEAENVKTRLKKHLSDPKKEFKEIIFFISKDELLTKTQIKYLESRLVQLAIDAKTAEIENANSPSLPTLHEADISDMEYFLDQMKLILPVMGFRFLIPTTVIHSSNESTQSETKNVLVYQIKTKNQNAEMYESDQGYIVKKGSQARKKFANSITDTYKNLRNKLVSTNVLLDKSDFFEFAEDTIFTSPSAASSVVLARNSNGFAEWLTNEGESFKEIQEKLNVG